MAVNEILYVVPLRGCFWLYLFLADRNPGAFHSKILCKCLSLALMLWAWEPDLGFRPHASQGELSQPRYVSLWNLNCWPWQQHQPFMCFDSSSQWWCEFFSKYLLISLLYSQALVCYSGWLSFNFVVFLIWSYEQMTVWFTYSATTLKGAIT